VKLKKKPVAGQCHANRCVAPAEYLCAKHKDEPIENAQPAVLDHEALSGEIEPVRSEQLALLSTVTTVQYADVIGDYSDTGELLRQLTGLELLAEVRTLAKAKFDELEEKRTSVTKPLLAAKRAVDDLFKPVQDSCKAVISACTRRLEDHARALRAEREAALAALPTAPTEQTAALVSIVTASEPMPDEVKVRTVLVFELVDFSLVPDAFKCLNESEIKRHIRETAGTQQIPGLNIFPDVKVV
jgi:hypothetical protein